MPDLPTLTVTSAQATRIQNAFPGATQAERVEAYRTWLRQALKGYVTAAEEERLRAKFDSDVQAAVASANSDLTGI